MNADIKLDELTLNAYIDGELDSEQEGVVLVAMQNDPDIREQVCKLRRARDWMRTGFADARTEDQPLPASRERFCSFRAGIAASLFAVVIGVGGGLLGYTCAERDSLVAAGQQDPMRVVLHIDDAEPAHFQAVLDYAENFLEANRGSGTQVEVVANSGGVDLMRSGGSAFEGRVMQLSEQYDNLHFVACMNSLRNLKREGINPVMIDDVHVGNTAVDHIVKRLQDGWTYRKVSTLENI